MASSGAARPALQRALQKTTGGLSSSRCSRTPALLHHRTQVRHATRATIAKAKAKAEELARLADPNAPKPPKPKRAVGQHLNRDNNRQRGLSVMRQTGPRERLSVSDVPLPRPLSPAEFPAVPTDPNHGLWDFFYSQSKPLNTPKEDRQHGRAWTVEELRSKGWDDLHSLWWVCIKERNRIATGNTERTKGAYGHGYVESRAREMQVRKTQNAIKHALTERFYAWEDALKLAKKDPHIRYNKGEPYYLKPTEPRSRIDENDVWEEEEEYGESQLEDDEAEVKKTGARAEGVLFEDGEAQVGAGEAKRDNIQSVDPSISGAVRKAQQDRPRA